MTAPFDPWEKDPFFSAAEEVQESADRMESVYRQWLKERKFSSNPSSNLSQDLRTSLGTAKWQLEQLQRAGLVSEETLVSKSTKSRHDQFITAIRNHISTVENSLKETNVNDGESPLSWVRLNKGEREELALFLSRTDEEPEKVSGLPASGPLENRVASANSESKDLKIMVSGQDDNSQILLDGQSSFSPPRMLSFSPIMSSRSNSKISWYWNGFTEWRGRRGCDMKETIPLRDNQVNQNMQACYEGSKSCLSSCADEACDKQLNGWVGAIQRQLQRSQYQIRYGRPIQMITWSFLAIILIVVIVLHSK